MKTKKRSVLMLFGLGFVVFSSGKLFAQKTGTTTLNVKLNPVMKIVVADPTVDFEFTTGDDYANGITIQKGNHLTVNSTNGFQVKVKSDGDLKLAGSSSVTIPIGDFSVTSSNGTVNEFPTTGGPTFKSNVALSNGEQTLMTSSVGIAIGSITVDYIAKGGADFVNIANQTDDGSGNMTDGATYSAILTYSITAN